MAVIAIDFDNTICDYTTHLPLQGVKDAVNLLREYNHKILINSCNQAQYIESTLNNYDIRFDHIWTKADGGKALADLYVDDRGFEFVKPWPETVKEILEHRHIKGKDNRKW